MKHFIIPDTQVKEGVDTSHIYAAVRYCIKKKPDVIIHLGDHWDMPSLSSYEKKGSKYFHDKNYQQDIVSGNKVMEDITKMIQDEVAKCKRLHKKRWNPRLVFCLGNHEFRINRAVWEDPILEGTISTDDFYLDGWEVYDYQTPVVIDGIAYCHNFVNPDSLTKNIIGGTIENKLKLLASSFTMGHQQKRQFGTRYTGLGKELMGLVLGRFYSHHEAYMGEQGQADWSGCVMKNEVKDGTYDPVFISSDFLLREYGK